MQCPNARPMSVSRLKKAERAAIKLLNEAGKTHILLHSIAVAERASLLGARFALDQDLLYLAGICHDLGGVFSPDEMRSQADMRGMALCEAERAHPFLLHQRFSRIVCEELLGILEDQILLAVECHTTLRAQATQADMALFLADKLAWDQEGEPPYRAVVEAALETSLETASLAYIDFALDHGMIKMPHRWLLEARCWLSAACMAH